MAKISINFEDLLPPKEAAKYVGVSAMTLWRWARDGKIGTVMLDHTYFHINELKRVKPLVRRRK